MQAVAYFACRDDAVPADFLLRHFLHAEDCAFALFIDVDQLREAGDRRIDNFIAQDDSERFIADQMLRAEDGMPQSHRFGLADVTEIGQIRNVPHLVEHLAFAAALEIFFQFERTVEVVFDRAFASACDDDDVFDAGGDRFFDDVLNQRFVDQRQHLFGGCFGGRKKACTQSGSGNNSFTYICSCHRGDSM